MYFTLAVSAATRQVCAALAEAAARIDPRVMPIPGPARVAWRAPGGRAAVLHWGDGDPRGDDRAGTSCAGTIWAAGTVVHARTGLTRVVASLPPAARSRRPPPRARTPRKGAAAPTG